MRSTRRRFGVLSAQLILSIYTSGCVVAPERVNVNCDWTHDSSLPSSESGVEQHLTTDALVAEELAIRYADAQRGFRSGRYVGEREYIATREQCLSRLLGTIAAIHGVDASRLRSLLRKRSLTFDLGVVFLPMIVVVCAAADFVARRIHRRFEPDERLPRFASLLLASVVLDVVAFQMGSIWSFFSEEEFRFHTNHLSYRAFYVPWSRHPMAVLMVGMFLFWLVAFCRSTTWQRRC